MWPKFKFKSQSQINILDVDINKVHNKPLTIIFLFFEIYNANYRYKGLVFCRNNGWIIKNTDKGLTVPKWVMIVQSKIPQIPQNLSAQAQKFGISMKNGFIGRPCTYLSTYTIEITLDFEINNFLCSLYGVRLKNPFTLL